MSDENKNQSTPAPATPAETIVEDSSAPSAGIPEASLPKLDNVVQTGPSEESTASATEPSKVSRSPSEIPAGMSLSEAVFTIRQACGSLKVAVEARVAKVDRPEFYSALTWLAEGDRALRKVLAQLEITEEAAQAAVEGVA